MFLFGNIRHLLRDDETHFVELSKHFFLRFFDNEFVSRNSESRLTVIHVLALLALPATFYTFYLIPVYDDIGINHPAYYPAVSLVDHCRYVFFSMIVIGFVAVLEWDALFPDQRDYATLTPLPLKVVTLFGAKITALAIFVTIFVADVSGIATLMYPCVAAEGIPVRISAKGFPVQMSLAHFLWTLVVHAIAVFGGSAFMFLFFVAVEGLLISFLSYRFFKKVSLYIQVPSMIVLLSMFFLLPLVSTLVPRWQHTGSIWMNLLPPLWFVGLYQSLLGSHAPVFQSLAHLALKALGVVALTSAVTYFLSYRRYVQRTIEQLGGPDKEPTWAASVFSRLLDRFVVRRPLERATFYFVAKTMMRSNKHRLYFAAYVGVGCAFVIEGVVAMLAGHTARWSRPDAALLSVPLVLSFFALSGMRVIFPIPAELGANWIFQLTEDRRRHQCLVGVKKSMLVCVVVPLFAVLFPFYLVLWGWQAALFQLLFGLTLSVALMELLLLRFFKIPFTCSCLPGKANITLYGVFYWIAFTTYAYTMASFEAWMFARPVILVLFLLVAMSGVVALTNRRNRVLETGFTLIFEDGPEPAVQELKLID